MNAIRAARLQELQKNGGQGSSSGGGGQGVNASGGNGGDRGDSELGAMLDKLLEPEARARLSRVNLVRPERARAVEQYVVRLAQSGQVRRKLTEGDIVEILDGLARDEQKRNETKIVFSRKNVAASDDEDDFFD